MAQEIIRATVPANNNWHTEDLEAKATAMGMSKSDLILKAVDMMVNFDDEFLKYIKHYSDGLNIPEYLIIQNMIIWRMGEEDAQREVWGSLRGALPEFLHVHDEKGPRTLTGKELFAVAKDSKVEELKRQKEQHDKMMEQYK